MNIRTKIITFVLAASVIVAGLVAVTHLKTRPFKAEGEAPIAELSAKINIDGETASGWLNVGGDCPDNLAPAIDGRYYCKLTTLDQNATDLQVSYLSYFDFDRDQTYRIPLQITPTPEGSYLVLAPDERLILKIAIDSATNRVSVERFNETTQVYDQFPPNIP